MKMECRQPDLFFLQGTLTSKVMFAAIEERQRIARAVERWEIQLVEEGVAEGSLFALLKDLRTLGVEDNLLLCGLDVVESLSKLVEDVELLEESSHELSVFLFCGRRGIGCRLVGGVTHGEGSLDV